MRRVRLAMIAIVVGCVSGCESVAYYAQSVSGHLSIMARRTSIDSLVADAATSPRLRERLRIAVDVREFASRELGLPDDGSYRTYVDLRQRFVVWNVIATPEFSLEPRQWCFPVVGCVGYRGYYSRARAQRYADELAANDELDVYIGGARAYSTLGWFDDPLLNTIVEQPLHYMAAVIFHELAHQRLYVPGDTAFNEAFAVALEREGVRRWLRTQSSAALTADYRATVSRQREFLTLVGALRERLLALYESGVAQATMRRRKAQLFAGLRKDYETLKTRWQGFSGYDRWFYGELNNAKLALVATYHDLVPAFERLLEQSGGDLEVYYQKCEALGALSPEERARRLSALIGDS